MTHLVIHGHFYQPPRENPWTGLLDREPSAHPWHDWNQRVHHECYRPNAFARIVDRFGRVERIVNNYNRISFNFGPTLLSWMERFDPTTYNRVIEADRESAMRRRGHGNAIAQAYNHAILPLCNPRDRDTQIGWGVADFRHRFSREPEALWLPETACNDATLGALIDAGLRYAVLSPDQAESVKPLSGNAWRDVSDGGIDPGVPYAYFHPDGSGRSITLFFYDTFCARAIAFEGALTSSQTLALQLSRVPGGPGRLVHVATDGESYGHHSRFGELALAHALVAEAPRRDLHPANYGEFLELHPPEMQARIKPGPNGEGTAWSCTHGVGRWYRDCGCQTGGRPGWNQAWRGPLRAAFDWLRDQSARYFEQSAGELLRDPWQARDAYIEVMLEPGSRDEWLDRQARRPLGDEERSRALMLLEVQRNALLMYSSCGWFFSELSGIETVQVLKYAGRALDLLEDSGLLTLRQPFLDILSGAQSNLPEMGNGADVFRRFVAPLRTTAQQVAASLAIESLVGDGVTAGEMAGFRFERSLFRRERHGRTTLATGRLQLEEISTGRRFDYARASLHFGGIDFYCAMRPFPGDEPFGKTSEYLWSVFPTASLPFLLRVAREQFGLEEFGLESVLLHVRERVSQLVYGDIVKILVAEFARTYGQYERTIDMLRAAGLDIPGELQSVADFALGHRLDRAVRQAYTNRSSTSFRNLLAVGRNVVGRGHRLDPSSPTARLLGDLVLDGVEAALSDPASSHPQLAMDLIRLAEKLGDPSAIERAQQLAALRLPSTDWPLELKELAIALRLAPAFREETFADN
jgi:alpha-amylase/alpha-mannosidase (GH57 family)